MEELKELKDLLQAKFPNEKIEISYNQAFVDEIVINDKIKVSNILESAKKIEEYHGLNMEESILDMVTDFIGKELERRK